MHNPYKYKILTLKILGFYLDDVFADGEDAERFQRQKKRKSDIKW